MNEREIVLKPGETVKLTTENARKEECFIYAMGLGGGKILFTGGANLVEAIDGSDWDWKTKDNEFKRTVYEDPHAGDPVLQKLMEATSAEIERFYENQMLKPNLIVVSLDYRHLGIKRLAGYPVAYGYQPIDEVRCVYMPPLGSI